MKTGDGIQLPCSSLCIGRSRILPGGGVLRKILDYLDTFPHGLIAHIEHDSVDPGLGTMGFYVDIKTQSRPVWARYGVTNYHVVRPCFDGSSLAKVTEKGEVKLEADAPFYGSDRPDADYNGVVSDRPLQRPNTEAEPRKTHNTTISQLRMATSRFRTPPPHTRPHERARAEYYQERYRLEPELNQKLTFFDQDKHLLGSPWVASGSNRKSPSNQRLDWAMIEISEGRRGSNVLPG